MRRTTARLTVPLSTVQCAEAMARTAHAGRDAAPSGRSEGARLFELALGSTTHVVAETRLGLRPGGGYVSRLLAGRLPSRALMGRIADVYGVELAAWFRPERATRRRTRAA